MSDVIPVQKENSSKSEKDVLISSKLSRKSVHFEKGVESDLRNPNEKNEAPPTKIRKSQRLILNNKNLRTARSEKMEEETEHKSKEDIFNVQSSYKCVLCNVALNSIENFLDHVKNVHLVKRTKISKKITRTETDALVCPECDECFYKMKHIGIVLLDVWIKLIFGELIYLIFQKKFSVDD